MNDLVDRAVKICCERGSITIEGLKATAHRDGYGRCFRFADVVGESYFCVNFALWTSSRDTPLWLLIRDSASTNRQKLRDRRPPPVDIQGLSFLSTVSDFNTGVPIYLKAGVEHDEVVADVVKQIVEIAHMTEKAGNGPGESSRDTAAT